MTKSISIKNVKFEFNIVKEKKIPLSLLKKKNDIEKELLLQTIEREREIRQKHFHWMN